MNDALTRWTHATGSAPWGVQHVLRDTLQAVADEQVTLAYNADYRDGSPCLINAAATMLSSISGEGGQGKPSAHFGSIVSAFDRVNSMLEGRGVNTTPGFVSPLAAEILVANFGELKEKPIQAAVSEAMATEAFSNKVFVEPSDEDITRDWLNALAGNCISEQHDEALPLVFDE